MRHFSLHSVHKTSMRCIVFPLYLFLKVCFVTQSLCSNACTDFKLGRERTNHVMFCCCTRAQALYPMICTLRSLQRAPVILFHPLVVCSHDPDSWAHPYWGQTERECPWDIVKYIRPRLPPYVRGHECINTVFSPSQLYHKPLQSARQLSIQSAPIHIKMYLPTPILTLGLALLASLTGTYAAPAAEALDIAARQAAPCNPDYVPSSCGACHYFRGCTGFQGTWIVPW